MNSSGSFVSKIIFPLCAILLVAGAFGVGVYIGHSHHDPALDVTSVVSKDVGQSDTVDFSPFWQTWALIDKKYVATHHASSTSTSSPLTSDTPKERLLGAIKGMVASLGDPYTVFFSPEESKIFKSEISGNFEGVGMEMGIKDGILTVVTALPGTPADKAGLTTGDKLYKINDTLAAGLSVDQAVNLIRGPKGTEVVFSIVRGDEKEPRVIKVVRDTISIPTIDYKLRSDGVFVIRLYSFTAESPNLFRNALREFVNSNSNKLVLDLRGNPGGYLDAAVDIASWFLPNGKVVVREVSSKGSDEKDSRSKGYDIFTDDLKFAILINGGSASASEILAGALSEYGKAKLIGTRSFGKGSVQELVPITSDTMLKVTVARWLTPNGVSISDGGLSPDINVDLTRDDFTNAKDPQLDRAVEFVKTGK